jgi:hypothetical protein
MVSTQKELQRLVGLRTDLKVLMVLEGQVRTVLDKLPLIRHLL